MRAYFEKFSDLAEEAADYIDQVLACGAGCTCACACALTPAISSRVSPAGAARRRQMERVAHLLVVSFDGRRNFYYNGAQAAWGLCGPRSVCAHDLA